MTHARMAGNLLGVFLPFVALALAVVLLWDQFVGPEVLAITAVMYVLTALGITVGLHRLFAHRAFSRGRLGARDGRGPRDDVDAGHADPVGRRTTASTTPSPTRRATHTAPPHRPQDGFCGALAGLWHAHMGLDLHGERAARERYAPDLLADPSRFVDRTDRVWIALGLR